MTITMSNGRIQYDREAAGKLKGQSHELRMRDFLPRSTAHGVISRHYRHYSYGFVGNSNWVI